MARWPRLGEVPFGCYYGGVDTTPLFVMLAGAYEHHTADRSLIDEIWGNLLAATSWIERRLDASSTGFLDYARGKETGLANQAWKDSHDSMFHADGHFPPGPLGRCRGAGLCLRGIQGHGATGGRPKGLEKCRVGRACRSGCVLPSNGSSGFRK